MLYWGRAPWRYDNAHCLACRRGIVRILHVLPTDNYSGSPGFSPGGESHAPFLRREGISFVMLQHREIGRELSKSASMKRGTIG